MNENFTTHAFNFDSAISGGVDPRTGLYTVQLLIGELVGNRNQGPFFKARLGYSPLARADFGYGIGFKLGHSYFDSEQRLLVLSNGEQYRVVGALDAPQILQKHTDHFRFNCTTFKGERVYRICWKDGSIEILAGPNTTNMVKLPLRTFTPVGHSLNWTWLAAEVNQPPRLASVSDDSGATLMDVKYTDDIVTTFTLWPGTPDQADISLLFSNNYLTSIEQHGLVTTLGYGPIGRGTADENPYYLTYLKHPTGLVETAVYNIESMQFPVGAGLTALPAVEQHTLVPGAGQPNIVRRFAYSENNYLASGCDSDWTPDLDALYGIAAEYEYWSWEKLINGGTDYIVIARAYNNFHLKKREETQCGPCVELHEMQFHARLGEPFEKQPKTFLLPREERVSWLDNSRPAPGAEGRKETAGFTFDDAGNPIIQVGADGTRTEYEYYDAEGQLDARRNVLCPPEPNGFIRLLKSVKVFAPDVEAAQAVFKVPTTETRYTYRAAKSRVGSPNEFTVLQDSEQQFIDGALIRKIERAYVDNPAHTEHCRMQKEVTSHYSSPQVFTSTRTFEFKVTPETPHVLDQTVVASAFDGLEVSERRLQSMYSGRLLEQRDHQGLRTTYEYDQIGRLVSETFNAGSDYEQVIRYTHKKDDEGLLLIREDALGNKAKTRLDGLGRVVQMWQWDNDGEIRQWLMSGKCDYDFAGRLAYRETYDWINRTADNPDITQVERFSYDHGGHVVVIESEPGLKAVHRDDPIARNKSTKIKGLDDMASDLTETIYDLRGHPSLMRTYANDGSSSAIKSQRETVHDAWGRIRRETDELGRATGYEYDQFSRVVRITLPDETIIEKEYPPFTSEPLISVIRLRFKQQGQEKTIELGTQTFDGLGRILASTNGGRRSSYEYHSPSTPHPSIVIQPDGNRFSYTRIPELGGVIAFVGEESSPWRMWHTPIEQSFSYDARSGAVIKAEASQVVTCSKYFPSGRLRSETQYADGLGRSSTHFEYSLQGRLVCWTGVDGQLQQYHYDRYGRLDEITDPAVTVTLRYAGLGRLTSWMARHRLSTFTPTLTTTLTFDASGREIVRHIRSSNGATTNISQTWLANDQLSTRTLEVGAKVQRKETFTYDERNRLTSYACQGTDVPANEYGVRVIRQFFTFDPLDNITQCVSEFEGGSNTATFEFSKTDPCQLVCMRNTHEAWPQKLKFDYDDAGRMLTNERGQTLAYDAMGRLKSTKSNAQESEYRYDPFNRLMAQKIGDETEFLFYRAEHLVNSISGVNAANQSRLVRMGPVTLAQVSMGSDSKTWLTGTNSRHEVVTATNGEEYRAYAYGPYGARHVEKK